MRTIIANSGQWIGMVVVGVGLGVQFCTTHNYALILITAGSAAFAIFTKIKHHTPGVWVWRRRIR